ncbi:MAG TPA: DNA-binding domain-containing protein [Cellvibrio sp.]|nr:DNA-binding domain-containing protein [Cellvibrio sp.]
MNPPTLAKLQQALQGYLLDQPNTLAGLTVATEKFSQQQRLDIYHSAYRLRLMDVLKNDYPALALLLGESDSEKMLLDYIAQHPSQDPSLRWLGAHLPGFLRRHAPWREQEHLCELAAFEWAQITVFDAEDTVTTTLDDLRLLDAGHWPQLQLHFHPALQLEFYFSNAPILWQALINQQGLPAITLASEAQAWLVWRNGLDVVYRSLEPAEAWSLQAFSGKQNFSSVCAGLCNYFPEDQVPLKAVHYLQQWLIDGLVVEIT